MQISAKTDYALRALCELACATPGTSVKADAIADAQSEPRAFLDGILRELRQAGLVDSRRGPDGGHRLARPAYAITVADVVRAMEGPLALVGRHQRVDGDGPAGVPSQRVPGSGGPNPDHPCLTAHGRGAAAGMPKYWSRPSAAHRAASRSAPWRLSKARTS